jgi:hypothetical protein
MSSSLILNTTSLARASANKDMDLPTVDEIDSCNPPNSVWSHGQCRYQCHSSALPSNDSRHTCVCGAHFEEGETDNGKVTCILIDHPGQCANWFGEQNYAVWDGISEFAERYSSTPWGIMKNNSCNMEELQAAGFIPHCGIQHDHNKYFRSCNGNCQLGSCVGHADL